MQARTLSRFLPLPFLQMRDLGSNFFLTEEDVGKPRAVTVAPRLAELNPLVRVQVCKHTTGPCIMHYGTPFAWHKDSLAPQHRTRA